MQEISSTNTLQFIAIPVLIQEKLWLIIMLKDFILKFPIRKPSIKRWNEGENIDSLREQLAEKRARYGEDSIHKPARSRATDGKKRSVTSQRR